MKVEVVEPDEFFEYVNSLDDTDPMLKFVKQILEFKEDVNKFADDPRSFQLAFLQGKQNLTWSKKLAKLMPDLYPVKIPLSWEVFKKDLALAKSTGFFDRYRIKYSNQ